MSGYYHLTIPILAGILAYLAIPPGIQDGGGKTTKRYYHRTGMLCDIWTILSSVVVVIAWAICDLNFDGSKLLAEIESADNTVVHHEASMTCAPEMSEEECNNTSSPSSWESTANQPSGGMPSLDEVSDAISQHCWVASFILGTAMVLELLQVVAHRTVARRPNQDDKKDNKGQQQGENSGSNSIYTLFGWHDSECLLMVYALLFVTHMLMSNDRAGQTFGLIFAEPVAAAAGYYRPVSTIRFIEWAIASPTLMSLVGRSIPRLPGADTGRKIPDTLRPALIVTVSFIFVSWIGLLVEDSFWRWILISVSFMGYILSVIDQLYAWKIDADEAADCARVSDVLLKVQMLVYGCYGVAFLLPLFDLIDPITEQALLTYTDATIKGTCSAFLGAMRQADSLAEAKRERTKADAIALDLRQIIHDANAPSKYSSVYL